MWRPARAVAGRGRRGAATTSGRAASVGFLVLVLGWTPAASQEYHVDRGAQNVVRFTSRASIEEFDGVTDRVDGFVLLDAKTLEEAVGGSQTQVYLEVDLASLDTGIGLRNRHMRENYLETSKYPFAVFEGRIESRESVAAGEFRVVAQGLLRIHGVARARQLTCRVTPRGKGYRAQCDFEVRLSDHDIEIPKVMFLKLANEIRLRLDFSVVPAEASTGEMQ